MLMLSYCCDAMRSMTSDVLGSKDVLRESGVRESGKRSALKRMQNREQWVCEIQARADIDARVKARQEAEAGSKGAEMDQASRHVVPIEAWHGPEGEEPLTDKLERTQEKELTDPKAEKKYWILMELAHRDLAYVHRTDVAALPPDSSSLAQDLRSLPSLC
jgi:hypothetical protein